ncbi:MAG: hypothetical protein ACOZE7_22190 [Pseudomonadota bacterium]
MSAQFKGVVVSGLYRHRKRLLWLGLAVISSVAVAGWSVWGVRTADVSTTPAWPEPVVAPAGVSAQAGSDAQALFRQECETRAARRLYLQARKHCQRFTAHPGLAGQAHAVMATLMAAPPLQDLDAAVVHARKAASLGDARGEFIMALFMLSGHVEEWSLEAAQVLLERAQRNGVTAAARYLQTLSVERGCSAQASLKPMDVPLFCGARAEVLQQLQSRGMKHRLHNEEDWRDELSPGDAISAASVDLQFDVDPQEQLPRLARMRYVFDASLQGGPARWHELFDSLSSRYGRPGTLQQGQQAIWPMPDGTVVRLSREAERSIVAYEHPARLKQREAHLAQVQDGLRQARLLAQAHAL